MTLTAAEILERIHRILSPKQIISLVESFGHRIALWHGAVSGGKTFISLWALLIAIRNADRGGQIAIVGRTLGTIETNIMAPLMNPEIFGELAGYVKYTPGAKTAQILGRTVHLYGANTLESETKIRGATMALAYVDEATIIPEGFWDMLQTRLRTPNAHCLATTNPGSLNHWLRKKWILNPSIDLVDFSFRMEDNPALTPTYIEQTKASFSGVFYQRFILGLWTNAAGAVYPSWDPRKHVIPWDNLPPIARTLAVGMDYGTTNTTAALMLGLTDEPRQRLILMDEWTYSAAEHHGRTLPDIELSARFRAWANLDHHPFYAPDPEFIFLDPSAASMRAQLARDGVTTWKADNDVQRGLASVNTLISRDLLYSTDRCAGWNTEITEYAWDAKKAAEGIDAVVKAADHSMDGGRYAVRSSIGGWEHILAA